MLKLQAWCHACFAEPHDSITKLVRHFLEPATHCDLSSDDFPHLADDFTALTQYLQGAMKARTRGVNLLIYGAPGTGKTVFAKALAQSLNAHLYEVANHFDNGEPIHKGERLAFLKMSEKFLARRKDSLILFDEIEDVFPERFDPTRPSIARRYAATGKAWINQTLENNQVPVIWISNNIEQMDQAYLRRFSYHLEIRTPPLRIRQPIEQRYLGNTGMRSDFIKQLASDTALTPALMENAAHVGGTARKRGSNRKGLPNMAENYRSIWADMCNLTLRQGYVQAGVRTRFVNMGPEDGKPLIMIHGMGGSWENLFCNYAAHAEHFNTYGYDMIGHGFTEKPDKVRSTIEYAEHLKNFLDAMKIEKASLLGLSLGSWVATKFASLYPERVDKVTMISAWGRPYTSREQIDQNKELMSKSRQRRIAAVVNPTWEAMDEVFNWLIKDPTKRVPDLLALRQIIHRQPEMKRAMENILDGVDPET